MCSREYNYMKNEKTKLISCYVFRRERFKRAKGPFFHFLLRNVTSRLPNTYFATLRSSKEAKQKKFNPRRVQSILTRRRNEIFIRFFCFVFDLDILSRITRSGIKYVGKRTKRLIPLDVKRNDVIGAGEKYALRNNYKVKC